MAAVRPLPPPATWSSTTLPTLQLERLGEAGPYGEAVNWDTLLLDSNLIPILEVLGDEFCSAADIHVDGNALRRKQEAKHVMSQAVSALAESLENGEEDDDGEDAGVGWEGVKLRFIKAVVDVVKEELRDLVKRRGVTGVEESPAAGNPNATDRGTTSTTPVPTVLGKVNLSEAETEAFRQVIGTKNKMIESLSVRAGKASDRFAHLREALAEMKTLQVKGFSVQKVEELIARNTQLEEENRYLYHRAFAIDISTNRDKTLRPSAGFAVEAIPRLIRTVTSLTGLLPQYERRLMEFHDIDAAIWDNGGSGLGGAPGDAKMTIEQAKQMLDDELLGLPPLPMVPAELDSMARQIFEQQLAIQELKRKEKRQEMILKAAKGVSGQISSATLERFSSLQAQMDSILNAQKKFSAATEGAVHAPKERKDLEAAGRSLADAVNALKSQLSAERETLVQFVQQAVIQAQDTVGMQAIIAQRKKNEIAQDSDFASASLTPQSLGLPTLGRTPDSKHSRNGARSGAASAAAEAARTTPPPFVAGETLVPSSTPNISPALRARTHEVQPKAFSLEEDHGEGKPTSNPKRVSQRPPRVVEAPRIAEVPPQEQTPTSGLLLPPISLNPSKLESTSPQSQPLTGHSSPSKSPVSEKILDSVVDQALQTKKTDVDAILRHPPKEVEILLQEKNVNPAKDEDSVEPGKGSRNKSVKRKKATNLASGASSDSTSVPHEDRRPANSVAKKLGLIALSQPQPQPLPQPKPSMREISNVQTCRKCNTELVLECPHCNDSAVPPERVEGLVSIAIAAGEALEIQRQRAMRAKFRLLAPSPSAEAPKVGADGGEGKERSPARNVKELPEGFFERAARMKEYWRLKHEQIKLENQALARQMYTRLVFALHGLSHVLRVPAPTAADLLADAAAGAITNLKPNAERSDVAVGINVTRLTISRAHSELNHPTHSVGVDMALARTPPPLQPTGDAPEISKPFVIVPAGDLYVPPKELSPETRSKTVKGEIKFAPLTRARLRVQTPQLDFSNAAETLHVLNQRRSINALFHRQHESLLQDPEGLAALTQHHSRYVASRLQGAEDGSILGHPPEQRRVATGFPLSAVRTKLEIKEALDLGEKLGSGKSHLAM
jgi:hypothetical protein